MNNGGNVLLTSGGKGVGLVCQLREAMNRHPMLCKGQLLVASSEAFTPAGCFADGSVQVPLSADSNFVPRLLEECRQNSIRVLIPLSDQDLNALAPRLNQFAALGTAVICPPPALVTLCQDKMQFAQFAAANALNHPLTRMFPHLEGLCFPVFCKLRSGSGSVGAGVCASHAEAALRASASPDLLFQELVNAPEISIDAYNSRAGVCIVCVQRVRDQVVGGQAYQSHTVNVPLVGDLALRTISALAREGLRGPLNVQIFNAATPVLVEVNPRLGSAVVLSNMACSGRLLDALLTEALGGVCTGDPFDYRVGLQLKRYLGDIFFTGSQVVSIKP
jgi:carbamoyl-phosphate synthase large subunit